MGRQDQSVPVVKTGRGWGLWLLTGLFAVLGSMGIVRSLGMIQDGAAYLALGMQTNPALLAVLGGIWAVCGWGAVIFLLFRLPSAAAVAWAAAGLISLSYWFDRLFLWVKPGLAGNWLFALLLNVLLLGWMFLVLRGKKARSFFRKE